LARVNVEDRFFGEVSRLRKFARMMKWSEREAAGALLFLWHDSQEQLMENAPGEDIADWCRVPPEGLEAILQALLSACYIESVGENKYFIHGNKKNIRSLQNLRRRSKKGGRSTKKKWEMLKYTKSKKKNEDVKEGLQASLQLGAMHSKAKQCNTKQKYIYTSDFEKIWNQFPKKGRNDKSQAFTEFKKCVDLGAVDEMQLLSTAIAKYQASIDKENKDSNTEWRRPRDFKRWIKNWKDSLDLPDAEPETNWQDSLSDSEKEEFS